MVAKSDSPAVPDNSPASSLLLGTEDQVHSLGKQLPVILPNQSPEIHQTEVLKELRTSFKYIYVVNWLYHCRGFVKLHSEYFDVDIFELELLNHFPNNSFLLNLEDNTDNGNFNNSFINKLKLQLISSLQNSKLSSLKNFEKIFRLWFGVDTPLGGVEEDDEHDEDDDRVVTKKRKYYDDEIKFDNLLIADKFEILYMLISYITKYSSYRNWIDRNNLLADELRVNSLYSEIVSPTKTQEDYLLLFDNCRLYKRTINYNTLIIPKKRKLSPEFPNEFFNQSQFDIKPVVKYELIYKNIYELNDLLKELNKKKTTKFKTLAKKLSRPLTIDLLFECEIKKRRFISNKKKEIQLASLLATRKRSSRLEAKEKQKLEEERILQKQEDAELHLGSKKRLERRRRMKFQADNGTPDYTGGLSRDERLKLRKSTPDIQEFENYSHLQENGTVETNEQTPDVTLSNESNLVELDQPQDTNILETNQESNGDHDTNF